jgi:hypothetical protein
MNCRFSSLFAMAIIDFMTCRRVCASRKTSNSSKIRNGVSNFSPRARRRHIVEKLRSPPLISHAAVRVCGTKNSGASSQTEQGQAKVHEPKTLDIRRLAPRALSNDQVKRSGLAVPSIVEAELTRIVVHPQQDVELVRREHFKLVTHIAVALVSEAKVIRHVVNVSGKALHFVVLFDCIGEKRKLVRDARQSGGCTTMRTHRTYGAPVER